MIVKCPHCAALLECSQTPGEIVDCAGCGKTFAASPCAPDVQSIPRIVPKQIQTTPNFRPQPWKDDGMVLYAVVVGAVASLAPFAMF